VIHHGDCVEVMAGMEPESIDAIVTDPPYGLEFMGKEWDRLVAPARGRTAGIEHEPTIETRKDSPHHRAGIRQPSMLMRCDTCGGNSSGQWNRCKCDHPAFRQNLGPTQAMQAWHQQWAEAAYRVARPSAYLLAFGGTRTVHRMTVALEDAGWIIRDMLVWGYASGFPKSKASLKPAWEPIVMARKPGPLRMLAIDECRIPVDPNDPVNGAVWTARAGVVQASRPASERKMMPMAEGERMEATAGALGRWPANIVLTDPIFDGGIEGVVGGGWQSGGGNPRVIPNANNEGITLGKGWHDNYETGKEPFDTEGTYSRFFLIPKADRADREPVLGGLPTRVVNITEGHGLGPVNTSKGDGTGIRENRPRSNVHPTVKPVDLMRHLVRLVTPTGGTVLDPFLGSGTTALAAEMEGFPWIGIEREAEYVAIAEARLNGTQRGLGLEAS
jgi:DNA modification methylase